nr:integrase, catalytic region, zinc finger, CCHC-type, peptidase aspartic, catalytic [Tanacetum cinerariifolium]
MIVDSIKNGPYVRRMIATLGEPNLPVPVPESFHEQTDEELTETDIKRMDADDQAIQTILLGLPEDVYTTVDSCETTKEIWERDRLTQNVRGNGGNQFRQYAGQVAQNQQGFNAWQNGGIQGVQNAGMQSGGNQNGLVVVLGIPNQSGTGNVVAARAECTGNGNQARCYNYRGLGHIARNCDLDEIEEVNANCILMANLQQTSTSGSQHDRAPVYDTEGSVEAQLNDNCYDNKIFNMFTQKEQYTDLLEPIPEPQLVPQNDNHVTSVAPSTVQSAGTVEISFAPNEETRAHQETVYRNLVKQVAQVNMINCNMRATNAELKYELAGYKIQEQRVEISQEKYDKLERCYQKSVYQEQCLTRKINALHLSFAKQITTLNDEISNLNKQLSKEKSSISSLMDENKRLKQDFKIQEDKFLDKEVDLEVRIKDLENILLKKDQTVQTMHMFNPKPDSFYHPNQKMALEHDPPAMYDSGETLELAQESHEKMRILKKEIKPSNYAKINHLSGVFVPQTTKSKEELFLSNISNMVTVSKMISIPNEDLSDDTTPSVARKFLNKKLKSKIVELEFQVVNYERKISHLKTTYKNLFDSIKSNRARAKLHDLIFENAKLKARLFENTSESVKNVSGTSVTHHVDKPKLSVVTPLSKKLNVSMSLHSVPQPREFNVVKHRNMIAPGMFKINPSQTPRENVSSNTVTTSSTGLVHTARTRRPQPKGNTRNARIPSVSKSSEVKKNVVQICLWCVDPGCSKHMTRNIKLLINFVWKFLGTLRFGNDHIAAILGYDDYSQYTWVYFLRTKDEMPECDLSGSGFSFLLAVASFFSGSGKFFWQWELCNW